MLYQFIPLFIEISNLSPNCSKFQSKKIFVLIFFRNYYLFFKHKVCFTIDLRQFKNTIILQGVFDVCLQILRFMCNKILWTFCFDADKKLE